jgi:hypothetical protein
MLVQELILAREKTRTEEDKLARDSQAHKDEAAQLKKRVMTPQASIASSCAQEDILMSFQRPVVST